MGEAAAAQASSDAVAQGCVGAGTGATVGKALGLRNAMKGGIGSYTVDLGGGVLVAALAANNAIGDVRDPANGKIVAGARKSPDSQEFADGLSLIKSGTRAGFRGENTVLAVIATNARLTKPGAAKLAQQGHQGLARTVYPASTISDGDVVFALSAGDLEASPDALGIAAAEAMAGAILASVRNAKSLGGIPGLAG
jgi:L-aminopeptidase/D-esterase-like protein